MPEFDQELTRTYQILGKIGSGGGGTIYKAYHKNLEKEVVLKRIHSGLLKNNIRTEVDILKNLKSPYLPQVFDFLQVDGAVYTVMDYIPGQSLKEVLQEKTEFSQSRVIKWMDQLCQAVEQLHTQNPPIIHGDIKPANIMLTPKDDICLIDFNISGDFQDSDILGFTPGYAAPEQMKSVEQRLARLKEKRETPESVQDATVTMPAGSNQDATVAMPAGSDQEATVTMPAGAVRDAAAAMPDESGDSAAGSSGAEREQKTFRITIDERSDIYSIGATVYHLLTGQCPDKDEVKPIWEVNPSLEDSLAYLVMKCLNKDPAGRYQSVQELHQAVLNVHQSGKAYKRLKVRQLIIRLALAAGTVGFAALAGLGYLQMQRERQDAYLSYVDQMDAARQAQDYDLADGYYRQAIALYPDGPEAALEMVRTLYQQKRYEDVLEFVSRSVINVVTDETCLGNIYYLYGNSYFELGEYEAAEEVFRQAIAYAPDNALLYRDHAITLAKLNRAEEAETQLNMAVQLLLGNDSIYYTQGEINGAQGNWQEALADFRTCIETTEDDYMKMRAYLMCNTAMEQGAGTLEDQAALLEEARGQLPMEYQNAVLEELAQVYIDLSNVSGDASYDMKAVEVFTGIVNNGWGIYSTYNNIAVLYQKNQMYSEEKNILDEMLKLFGENYNTYKRLAFMEAGAQMQAANEEREYHTFAEYYENAVALYEEQLANNQTDLEMTTLQELYQQAVDGGWLEAR